MREVAGQVAGHGPGLDPQPAGGDERDVAAERFDGVAAPADERAVHPDVAAGRADPEGVEPAAANRDVARYGLHGQVGGVGELDRGIAGHGVQLDPAATPRSRVSADTSR